MPNRFVLPLETPVDATGLPYAGGKLFFYASGTSTKLNTYTDPDLDPSHANTNPVVLDSAGRFPNAIFLQNLAYKVVFSPSTDSDPPTSPIWTQDPVYASDYSTYAQVKSVNGSPNGQLAGTAGSATILASMAWDFANNILYVCITSGTALTAVWTAVNAATAANVVPPPQGRLTLTSGTPVLAGDVTAATAVYYTPYIGDDVPIYNGTTFIPSSIVSELQTTLTSSYVASNIYDAYLFSLNGVVTFGFGPSWSAGTGGSITAGSCARGTGVGGAAISRVQGLWTNAVSMTIRYGDGTATQVVDANKATYVGTMFVDGTNGQVSCYVSFGQSRKWGLWNAYNRVPIVVIAGDGTASWNNQTQSVRPSNNNSANSLTTLTGLPEEWIETNFKQRIHPTVAAGANIELQIGIGWNSTSAVSGDIGSVGGTNGGGGSTQIPYGNAVASYSSPPSIGINVVTALEYDAAEQGTSNLMYGTTSFMKLKAQWRG